MSILARFEAAFAEMPLIAILRGIGPDEVEAAGEALVTAGFTLIEVPLNSPNPFASIERLALSVGSRATVGAGTVLNELDVGRVRDAGGEMVISPNADTRVIATTAACGLVSLPGIATPTEAFAALSAGATALKLFPAEAASPAVLKAMRAVLPSYARVLPVGGIAPDTMAPWRTAGAAGFGLGSALYRPGMTIETIGENATAFVEAWRGG